MYHKRVGKEVASDVVSVGDTVGSSTEAVGSRKTTLRSTSFLYSFNVSDNLALATCDC